jgi:hypothetical protein
MNVNTVNARQAIGTFGAVLLGVAVACAPTLSYAQHSFGGGHVSGGGHFGGGGHAGGGRSAGGHSAGGHVARSFGGGARYAAPHFAGGGYAAHGFAGARSGFAGHPGFAGGRAGWGGAHYWGGGYWGGRFWPHAYFYPGYAWFLPLLPLGYATYWWGGLPYYYANDLYYTWNPGYNGYVVTDPPPVSGTDSADAPGDTTGDASQYGADASQYSAPQPPPAGVRGPAGSADVYVYPRNGQNDQQTSTDRYQCHSWAVNQTGFDPTRSGQQAGNPADYRRAIIACLDARGYTAR